MDVYKRLKIEFDGINSTIKEYTDDGYICNYLSKLETAIKTSDKELMLYCLEAIDKWYKDNLENIVMAINNHDQREILRLRYFDNLSWADVAEQLDTDDIDWVKEQHRKALKKIHVECTCCFDGDDFDADEE